MFDLLVDRVSAALWNLAPSAAVSLGKHEYDGVVPDVGDDAVEAQLHRLHVLRRQLFDQADPTPEQELDRTQLATVIDRLLFSESVLRPRARNPMHLVGHLDIRAYLQRDYAPKPLRLERMAEVLEAAPRLLAQARQTLQPPIPIVASRWGIRAALALAEALTVDVPDRIAGSGDRLAEARALEAIETASVALRSFGGWIEDELVPGGDDAFAIGADSMEEMLRVGELVDTPLGDLLAMGEADLAANQHAFAAAAGIIDPGRSPVEVFEDRVAAVHPSPDELIPAARNTLEEVRRFLVERDLITIPGEPRARVAATPRHLRWARAMTGTPGPYETGAIEAVCTLTPVEDEWSPAQAEEWLRALNQFTLANISIHEAYPGHYVHALHIAAAPTEVSRRSHAGAFTEGWAHYAEQMMWEQGFGGDDARFHLAQLSEALLRDCRFICAIRMHAGDMTTDEAARFFADHAFCGEMRARMEAERGTFDPGYLSSTLGKLQILRLREDCRAAWGDGFDLKTFHDRLLSRGAPPVALIRRVLLPD